LLPILLAAVSNRLPHLMARKFCVIVLDMFFNRSDSTQELADLCESKTNLADAAPGEQTICYHFQIHSNLGWIQWKDREASLYT
jgi:hypothetical protein